MKDTSLPTITRRRSRNTAWIVVGVSNLLLMIATLQVSVTLAQTITPPKSTNDDLGQRGMQIVTLNDGRKLTFLEIARMPEAEESAVIGGMATRRDKIAYYDWRLAQINQANKEQEERLAQINQANALMSEALNQWTRLEEILNEVLSADGGDRNKYNEYGRFILSMFENPYSMQRVSTAQQDELRKIANDMLAGRKPLSGGKSH